MSQPRKLITILSPAFNEEANLRACYDAVRQVMAELSEQYTYEHLFADNASEDRTLEILRELASEDPRVKVLVYSKNFGADKSVMTMLRHAKGDAAILLVTDLQDPPEDIPKLIKAWEAGAEIVYGIYENAGDGFITKLLRRAYYNVLNHLSEEPIPKNHSSFLLLDQKVFREVVRLEDFNPSMRGMVSSVGFRRAEVPYRRVARKRGKSKHNWGFLIIYGLTTITRYSLVPLRIATIFGILMAGLSILMSLAYALVKIFNWNFQAPGATTTIVLILFFSGIQLFFLGILGEYVGAIHSQVRGKPYVVIREKINCDE